MFNLALNKPWTGAGEEEEFEAEFSIRSSSFLRNRVAVRGLRIYLMGFLFSRALIDRDV